MRLEFGVYTVLLAASLGGAYWASLPRAEGEEERVALFAVEPRQVTELALATADTEVRAVRAAGERFWVHYKKTEPADAPKKDPHAALEEPPPEEGAEPAPPPPAGEPKVTTERFLGNEKLDELLQALNPLKAQRVIGKVDAAQLEEYGLKDAKDRLSITAGGKTIQLVLGKKSYGSRSRFVLEGDRVVLVDDQGFENLERANLRLYDRRLVPFELDDVHKAEVIAGERQKRLSHTQRNQGGELVWSDDDEGAAPKPAYGTWMDKIARLRLTGYADEDKEATLARTEPFLAIAFEKDGKVLDVVRFKKLQADKPEYYVTSDFLKAHGKLAQNRVEPLEKDLGQVLATD